MPTFLKDTTLKPLMVGEVAFASSRYTARAEAKAETAAEAAKPADDADDWLGAMFK